MTNDALRRQITEEIQGEFEIKLRNAKRQKEQAEADLEAATERWRTEKRRLNSEIDRLEAAAAKGPDPKAAAKLQEAADEKLKKAAAEWEAERAQLVSQINRLEGAVAEAIARASNPLRTTQSVKDQFEAELARVSREKRELEQAFLRGRTEWEQEKLKLTGDLVKLKRTAQIMGKPIPKDEAPEANPKVRDLENQLKQALERWGAEREKLHAQIQKLEESSWQWDAERRQLNDHAGHLQQAFVQAQAQIQAYEVAARSPNTSEAQVEQLRRENESMQRESRDARNAWDSERRQLTDQIERFEKQIQRLSESGSRDSDEIVDLRKQYEEQLQEAIQQKTHLAEQLQNANSRLETERARLSAAPTNGGSGLDQAAINAEISRVETLINDIVKIIDDPATELSTIIRKNVEKAELDSYLKGIRFALAKK